MSTQTITSNGAVGGSNYGSTAAAMFEVAAVQGEININNNKISIEATQTQSEANMANCKATRQRANKQAMGMYLRAGGQATGVVANGWNLYADTAGTKELNEKFDTASKNLKDLEDLNKNVQEEMPEAQQRALEQAERARGAAPEQADDQADEATPEKNRIREMQRDQILPHQVPTTEGRNVSSNVDALKAATPGELEGIKSNIDAQISHLQKEKEILSNQMRSTQGLNQLKKSMVEEGFKAAFTAGEGFTTSLAGKQEALALADQYIQQTQQSVASQLQSASADNIRTRDGALQALVQVSGAA